MHRQIRRYGDHRRDRVPAALADAGLGAAVDAPDRIDFDPFPSRPMGVWILTQMKRRGHIEGDLDHSAVAEQVFLASDAAAVMRALGCEPPAEACKSHVILGETFDPADPEGHAASFVIRKDCARWPSPCPCARRSCRR